MAVHYKFKSAKDFDSVPIDGHCISVGRLKEKIVLKQKLGSASDVDLVISNADTDEEYLQECFPIFDNASVLVRRVPKVEKNTNGTPKAEACPSSEIDTDVLDEMETTPCIASDEDIKIKEFVDSSAAEWIRQTQDASNNNVRNQGSCFQRKTPPQGYVCHRCGVSGHFIQHCPTNGDASYDVKKVKIPSGIPKTMLVSNPDGAYALPSGEVAVLQPNEDIFAKEIEGVVPGEPVKEIPCDLRCPLCDNALRDAVLTSKCCFKSFCDKCIRDILLDKATCVCGAKNIRADDLLPNKTLRETVERVLSGSCWTNSAAQFDTLLDKPQSQDSTTTQVNASSNSDDGKAVADAEVNEENEEVEEVDYDEEGFDDLNLEEEVEEPEESPEAKASVVEEEKPQPETEKANEDPVVQPESKEVQCADTSKYPAVNGRPVRRGNLPHPYAVQYTGYWSASQMIGRPPYGYGGYYPGPFAAPMHFPVPPYKASKRLLSRDEFEARKADVRRRYGRNRGNTYQKPGDDSHRTVERPNHRARSKSPIRQRRSRSPVNKPRPRSSSPRRRCVSPRRTTSSYRRSSVSPVTANPREKMISLRSSPARVQSPRARSRSRSPQRQFVNTRNNNDADVSDRSPHRRVRDTDRSSPPKQLLRSQQQQPRLEDERFSSRDDKENHQQHLLRGPNASVANEHRQTVRVGIRRRQRDLEQDGGIDRVEGARGRYYRCDASESCFRQTRQRLSPESCFRQPPSSATTTTLVARPQRQSPDRCFARMPPAAARQRAYLRGEEDPEELLQRPAAMRQRAYLRGEEEVLQRSRTRQGGRSSDLETLRIAAPAAGFRRPMMQRTAAAGFLSRRQDEDDGFSVGTHARNAKSKSILRAARGASLEPGNGLDDEGYRRLLDEFELSQRPAVNKVTPTMQRSGAAAVPRRNPIRKRRNKVGLMMIRRPVEEYDDGFEEDGYDDDGGGVVQRRAIFRRPEGLMRGAAAAFDFEEEEYEEEGDQIADDEQDELVPVVRRMRGRMMRGPPRVDDDDDELTGEGEDCDDLILSGRLQKASSSGDEMVVPAKMLKKNDLRRRLSRGGDGLLGAKQFLEEEEEPVVQKTKRARKKNGGGGGDGDGQAAKKSKLCKLSPMVKSVFERISFSNTKANGGGGGGGGGGGVGGGGGGGGGRGGSSTAGGQRMVVFYGDI